MEDRLVFDSRYVVGVEQVDREHQKLFELAGHIHDSLSVDIIVPMHEIRLLISELVESTAAHFAHEESLMGASGYPGLAEHRQIHADLISRIRDFEMKVELAEQLTPVDLYEFLCAWLGDHIQASDKMFGSFLSQRGKAMPESPGVSGH